ncbi:hypothetical protein [Actinacidiphila soli]|uniref:hypothetical protein n=1 Tax=Actinacidiphila soli TaxID=2487275 RepID=UPI0019CFD294|nr:hypothetical protein [Actinacidiphila soli]
MRPATLDAATLSKLISAAVAAPSIHNTQLCRYRLDPDTPTWKCAPTRNAACGTPTRSGGSCTSPSAPRCSTFASPSPTSAGNRSYACCRTQASRHCSPPYDAGELRAD